MYNIYNFNIIICSISANIHEEEFENDAENIEKLLQKPNNIKIRNLPVGEDFPMRVLSEIANAPFLSKEALINKCQYFVDSGADMIDIGMAAGEDFSDKIPDLIKTLRHIVGDRPLSIDTLNPKEIQVAAENGIDDDDDEEAEHSDYEEEEDENYIP